MNGAESAYRVGAHRSPEDAFRVVERFASLMGHGGSFARLRHVLDDHSSEWPESEDAELERLNSERNADDGCAKQESRHEVPDEELPAEEQEPENVEYG